ncbi:hypothetical protein D9758_018075 [Tetrapyrgos nigripes]|uniref:Uncharacterized protein n=1 Tax=Tetrapyrgos nigripes TaxID=182062 RepID=A0A8H5FFS8_9AGAR|nr:hypothetical protein D9758_018075 [Tetrapyrgos nigripes]
MSSGTLEGQQPSLPIVSSDIEVLKIWLLQTAVSWLLCGINVPLVFIIIFIILSQRKRHLNAQLILFAFVVLMFLFTIGHVVVNTQFILVQLPNFSYTGPNVVKSDQQEMIFEIATAIFDRLNFVIGDGIVIWRA